MKIMFGADLVPNKEKNEQLFINGDARALFGDALDVIKGADRFVVNLECALTNSENKIPKCGPNLKADPKVTNGLLASGVTDVVLANNHTFDFGIEGFTDTMAALEEAGLPYTGVGENDTDSRKIYYIDLEEGKKLAIVNVTEHEYSYALPNRMGCNPYDPHLTMYDIREAKKNADYVTVIYHGGKEHCRYPSPRIVNMAHEMVYNGADVVLLQHSHCIGCYENFEGSHIVYGQGNLNFVYIIDYPMWYTGLLVEVDFKGEHPDIKFYPLYQTETGVDLAKGEKEREIMDAFYERNEEMKAGKWREKWEDFCHNSPYNYDYGYAIRLIHEPDGLTVPRKLEPLKHYIDTETHRDVLAEVFKTFNWTNK